MRELLQPRAIDAAADANRVDRRFGLLQLLRAPRPSSAGCPGRLTSAFSSRPSVTTTTTRRPCTVASCASESYSASYKRRAAVGDVAVDRLERVVPLLGRYVNEIGLGREQNHADLVFGTHRGDELARGLLAPARRCVFMLPLESSASMKVTGSTASWKTSTDCGTPSSRTTRSSRVSDSGICPGPTPENSSEARTGGGDRRRVSLARAHAKRRCLGSSRRSPASCRLDADSAAYRSAGTSGAPRPRSRRRRRPSCCSSRGNQARPPVSSAQALQQLLAVAARSRDPADADDVQRDAARLQLARWRHRNRTRCSRRSRR